MNVTAIIPISTRPQNADRIVANLVKYPQINDIILVRTGEDKVWGRYLATERALNEHIYTQDDDVIPEKIGELLGDYEEDQDHIHCLVPPDYLPKIEAKTYGTRQLALVGFGAMFHSNKCVEFERYTMRYDEDEILRREADRIFTILQRQHHRYIVSEIEYLNEPTDPEALSSAPEHAKSTATAIERALAL